MAFKQKLLAKDKRLYNQERQNSLNRQKNNKNDSKGEQGT